MDCARRMGGRKVARNRLLGTDQHASRMPRAAGQEAVVLTRRTVPVVLALVLLVLTACGRGGGGGGGGEASSLPDHAEAASTDEEGTTYSLQAGRYRVSVQAPDCVRPGVQVNSVGGARSE